MKAAQIMHYGGQSAMEVVSDAQKPQMQPDMILVKVHAAATNPFDYKIREGYMQEYIPLTMPAILGSDVAGTVEAIGEDVVGFTVGDAVYGMANAVSGHGSYAEYTVVDAQRLGAKPQNIDYVTAAAFPLAAVCAYQALVDTMDLQPGQKILIHGGAGGVGALAIQLAKHLGAYVATTVSAKDTTYVSGLGADETIDYKSQDFSELLSDYDAVFDLVGGDTLAKSYAVLKAGGKLVSLAAPIDEALRDQYQIEASQIFSELTPERLAAITKLIESGVLKINVDKVFPLDQAPEALEYLKTGHPRGKVVIQVI